jgi:UDP-N-acetylmuramoylalanine--D-glutamate ligase
MEPMLNALKKFPGLEHRCQWVSDHQGANYFNDSKGTNVGATVAALEGLGGTLPENSRIVLIAGGVGKGADFSDLEKPVTQFCRAVIYIGEDGEQLATSCGDVEKVAAGDMADAVTKAAQAALDGDIVLLSPACASFDMFSGFPERGEKFVEAVRAL